jgi:uncharacterized membrane protein
VDSFFGIPSHPLFVHLPVVLIPLGFIGVIVGLVRPRWQSSLRWPTLVVTGLGTLGAILAAGSGEELQEAVRDTSVRTLVREHAESGETARTLAIIFFAVLLAVEFGPRFVSRITSQKWWRSVAVVALIVSGAVSTWGMFDAGHSGAKSVWNEVNVGDSD